MPISTKCTIARAAQSLGTPGSPLSRGCHNGDCLNREPFRAPPAAVDLGPCRTAAPTTRDVHLLVPDVDRAARSYRDEAGLTELSHWADPTFGGTLPVSLPRGLAQSSLSIPMASRWSCRPRRRSSHIREEIQQQLKSSTSRDLHGPGRAFRNDNLAFCSKPAQANHQSDGPVAVDIGPGNHSRGAGLPDRGFTRARGRCSDRACPHYPGHQRDCAAKRGEYPRGTRPGRCSAFASGILRCHVPVRLSRIRG
jgi:hypothetical protein